MTADDESEEEHERNAHTVEEVTYQNRYTGILQVLYKVYNKVPSTVDVGNGFFLTLSPRM